MSELAQIFGYIDNGVTEIVTVVRLGEPMLRTVASKCVANMMRNDYTRGGYATFSIQKVTRRNPPKVVRSVV